MCVGVRGNELECTTLCGNECVLACTRLCGYECVLPCMLVYSLLDRTIKFQQIKHHICCHYPSSIIHHPSITPFSPLLSFLSYLSYPTSPMLYLLGYLSYALSPISYVSSPPSLADGGLSPMWAFRITFLYLTI